MKELSISQKSIYSVIALVTCTCAVVATAVWYPKEISQPADASAEAEKRVIEELQWENNIVPDTVISASDDYFDGVIPENDQIIAELGEQIIDDSGDDQAYTNESASKENTSEVNSWEISSDEGYASDWTEETFEDDDWSEIRSAFSTESSWDTVVTDETSEPDNRSTSSGASGVISNVRASLGINSNNSKPAATEGEVIENPGESSAGGSSSYDASEGENYETPILPAR